METIEQKKRRLYGKQYLNEYFKELKALTNNEVYESDILSISETDNIPNLSISSKPSSKYNIEFQEKNKLLTLIDEVIQLKDGECFLFSSYSKDCGAMKLCSLANFNVNFNFDDEHSGIITIISADFSNQIIFDFFIENHIQYLEIELYGNDWFKARILN